MKTKCIIQDCNAKHHCRGLCKAHYTVAALLVKRKLSPPWEELEKAGRVLPARVTELHKMKAYLNTK
jgi:hypothetical protein